MIAALASSVLIMCSGNVSSGALLEGGHLVMSAHASGVCRHNGRFVREIWRSDQDDFVIASSRDEGGLRYSCEPMEIGQTYTLLGQTGVASATATDRYANIQQPNIRHVRMMQGLAVSGMSGGPVVDSEGVAYGIITSRNVDMGATFVKEFRDTPLCEKER